jgi:hypothetical protein
MSDRIKEQLRKSTEILDPYAKNFDFLVKIAESQDVNEGLILATLLFVASLIVIVLSGW